MLETLDHTIRIGSTLTFLYFDLLLKVALFFLGSLCGDVKHRFQSHLNCARSQASERLGTRLYIHMFFTTQHILKLKSSSSNRKYNYNRTLVENVIFIVDIIAQQNILNKPMTLHVMFPLNSLGSVLKTTWKCALFRIFLSSVLWTRSDHWVISASFGYLPKWWWLHACMPVFIQSPSYWWWLPT